MSVKIINKSKSQSTWEKYLQYINDKRSILIKSLCKSISKDKPSVQKWAVHSQVAKRYKWLINCEKNVQPLVIQKNASEIARPFSNWQDTSKPKHEAVEFGCSWQMMGTTEGSSTGVILSEASVSALYRMLESCETQDWTSGTLRWGGAWSRRRRQLC